ncbi:MAG: hypothetical protein ACTS2F_06025 [Thainema sp.]
MMKQDLQRIEATLRRLNTAATSTVSHVSQTAASVTSSGQSSSRSRSAQGVSFAIAKSARSSQAGTKSNATSAQTVPAQTATIQSPPQPSKKVMGTPPPTVQPFPAQHSAAQPLSLPKFKLPSFSNHRHSFNTELPLSLAREISLTVERWQAELRQVIVQIQDLYAEGPIVNGWLEQEKESSSAQVDIDTAILRNAEGEELLQYVEKICESTAASESADASNEPTETLPASASHPSFNADSRYQLCGLDADGRLWCRPCPSEQLPTVSMAIARYRKLRVLLNRKEQLEVHLRHAAEALVEVQSYLQRMVQPV